MLPLTLRTPACLIKKRVLLAIRTRGLERNYCDLCPGVSDVHGFTGGITLRSMYVGLPGNNIVQAILP